MFNSSTNCILPVKLEMAIWINFFLMNIKNGNLRSGIKSDIPTCFEDIHSCSMEKPAASDVILDGSVIVNMLYPVDCSKFKDYPSKVFSPFICCQLESCNRIDIVWDIYKENTLTASARRKRGSGTRRRFLPDSKIPSSWHSFLRIDEIGIVQVFGT